MMFDAIEMQDVMEACHGGILQGLTEPPNVTGTLFWLCLESEAHSRHDVLLKGWASPSLSLLLLMRELSQKPGDDQQGPILMHLLKWGAF